VPSAEPSDVTREEFDALKGKVGTLEEIFRRLHEGALNLQERVDEMERRIEPGQ
jgi:hypothetical protein